MVRHVFVKVFAGTLRLLVNGVLRTTALRTSELCVKKTTYPLQKKKVTPRFLRRLKFETKASSIAWLSSAFNRVIYLSA